MQSLDRRQFLGGSLCALGAAWAPRWLKDPAIRAARNDRRLVVLHLAGGNDGLATVTPFEDDVYYRARPTIGIKKKKLIKLDALNALHPSLSRIARRYEAGQVCIRQSIGHPNGNLSHFLSQDIWEAAATGTTLPGTGWLGRVHEVQPQEGSPVPLLAAGADRLPLALRTTDGAACVVSSLDQYVIRSRVAEKRRGIDEAKLRAMNALQATSGEGPLSELRASWSAAQASTRELERAQRFTTGKRFRGGKLGANLELVARVIGAGLDTRCFHVIQGGFDTHAGQLPMQRKELTQLDQAVDSFLTELKRQGNQERVLLLVVSEFGRRIEESGIDDTAGTDHGAGNCVLAFGDGVHAGLHGGQPDLVNLDENGNLIYRDDFRGIYADLLDNWLGVDSTAVLGQRFAPVKVVG